MFLFVFRSDLEVPLGHGRRVPVTVQVVCCTVLCYVIILCRTYLEVPLGHWRRVPMTVQVARGGLMFQTDQVARLDTLGLEGGLGFLLLRRHVHVVPLHQPERHTQNREVVRDGTSAGTWFGNLSVDN